jgi:hypothetical protein
VNSIFLKIIASWCTDVCRGNQGACACFRDS